MNIDDLKTIIPLMKNCIFSSKLVEDYGDIYFFPKTICVFNDECLIQHPVDINELSFSADFKIFEKVFSRLPGKEEVFFKLKDNALIVKAGRTSVKLNLKKRNLKRLNKEIEGFNAPTRKMKNSEEFFYCLDLAATTLAPFGTLSAPFCSYLKYENKEFTACSMFKGVKIKYDIGIENCPPFAISIDAISMLNAVYSSLSEKEDLHSDKEILFNVTKDKLTFDFGGVLKISVNNSNDIIPYETKRVSAIFSIEGKEVLYPEKEVFQAIIDRVSLFPKEFEDTTLRIFQRFESDNILFFSKNESGSIKEKFSKNQKIKEGTYSFSPKDFLLMLGKMDFQSKGKIHAKLCVHESGNTLLSFSPVDNCQYVIAIAKEEV